MHARVLVTMSAELLRYLEQHPNYNPPIKRNRAKLDMAHFRSMRYWRRTSRPRKLKCKSYLIDRKVWWNQFPYHSFPKDILYELGKSTRIGFRLLGPFRFERWIFLRDLQLGKLDPNLYQITDDKSLSRQEWARWSSALCMERVKLEE